MFVAAKNFRPFAVFILRNHRTSDDGPRNTVLGSLGNHVGNENLLFAVLREIAECKHPGFRAKQRFGCGLNLCRCCWLSGLRGDRFFRFRRRIRTAAHKNHRHESKKYRRTRIVWRGSAQRHHYLSRRTSRRIVSRVSRHFFDDGPVHGLSGWSL